MTPDDRRPFRGAPFDHGRNDRPAGQDRGDRPPGDRPPFGAGPPRPFARPVTRGGDMPAPAYSVRIRDGERELEVTGAPAFVRQILDDLPTLLGRLRGEAAGRTAISMPAPPAAVPLNEPVAAVAEPLAPTPPSPVAAIEVAGSGAATNGHATTDVEAQVFDVLRGSARPLAVSAIRERMASTVSGQQVRRILERADSRVKVSSERPATYSLR